MARQYRDKVRMIGVSGQDRHEAMEEFVHKYDLDAMDTIADTTGDVWRRLGNDAHPAWWFIDDDGTVTKRIGELDGAELREQLDRLVSS